nr:unnamed protein product [Callosobruchus chinensis]
MVPSSITNEDILKLIKETNIQMKAEIEQLNKNVTQLKTELGKVNLKYKDIGEENIALKNKVQNLEHKLKKYNIVIYGVSETEETAITQTVNFINNQLKAKKLPRGCGFYITNDYTQEEYNKRKVLYSHLRKAREDHKSAYIKNNILYVNGGQYSYEDLETDTTEEDDVTSGEYQQGTQNREIGDHIESSRKNTLETKKREERITEDLRYPKTKGCTQKGLSSTSSLLRNTPPKLSSNSSSAKV